MSYYMPPNTFLRTDSIFNKGEKPILKTFHQSRRMRILFTSFLIILCYPPPESL